MEEEQNNNVQPQPQPQGTQVPERKGFNITSMILGIISIVTWCIWYAGLPSSILAIIFSVAGRKDAGRGMGIAGMVLGIIALVFYVIFFALAIAGVAVLSENANTIFANSYLYY